MKKLSRREAMGTIITAGAGVTLAGMTEASAQTPAAPAFSGQHQIKPLPFDPAKLKGVSEKLIRSHHENNYSGAVRALNAVEQRLAAMLADKDLPPCSMAGHTGCRELPDGA
jgi:superoxide dismutase, Fe-Mn family